MDIFEDIFNKVEYTTEEEKYKIEETNEEYDCEETLEERLERYKEEYPKEKDEWYNYLEDKFMSTEHLCDHFIRCAINGSMMEPYPYKYLVEYYLCYCGMGEHCKECEFYKFLNTETEE